MAKWYVHLECDTEERPLEGYIGKTVECPGHYTRKGRVERHIAFPYLKDTDGKD